LLAKALAQPDLKKEVAYLDVLTSPMPTDKHKEAFHH
jgi:glutamate decarboxylase